MSQRSEELVKTTVIYAIGNIGSKFIRFLMVPIYTYFLSSEELGLYDLILTSLLLLEPIITLKITESTFRWLLDKKSDQFVVISTTFTFICISSFIGMIILVVVNSIYIQFPYAALLGVLLIARIISSFISEIFRGLGKNWTYSIYGISLTVSVFISALVALYLFQDKVEGLLISSIISTLSISFIFYFLKLRKFLRFGFSKPDAIEYLKYSIPLIPSSINWWGIKLLNRFVILSKLGLVYNGIFAVVFTFPQIMTILGQIFYMAWQKNSIESFKSIDRDFYYSRLFNKYVDIQFALAFVLMAISRLSFEFLFEDTYRESYYYSYPLLLGSVFNSFGAFYAVSYLGAKKTIGAFITSFLGLIVNVSILFGFTDLYGLWAASFANLFGFITLWVFRVYHSKKYSELEVPWSKIMVYCILFSVFGSLHFYFDGRNSMFIIETFELLIGIIISKELLKTIYLSVNNIIRR